MWLFSDHLFLSQIVLPLQWWDHKDFSRRNAEYTYIFRPLTILLISHGCNFLFKHVQIRWILYPSRKDTEKVPTFGIYIIFGIFEKYAKFFESKFEKKCKFRKNFKGRWSQYKRPKLNLVCAFSSVHLFLPSRTDDPRILEHFH